jgi:Tfp pilus assembly protein PilX
MLLGVTAALLSGTQFKLAANLQGENTAFNNAESAIAVAQTWLKTGHQLRQRGLYDVQLGRHALALSQCPNLLIR